MTAVAHDLEQGSALLYASPFDPVVSRRSELAAELGVPVAELLKLAVGAVIAKGYREPMLAAMMNARVSDHLRETPSLAPPIPIELAVALSVTRRPDSILTNIFDPKIHHFCRECDADLDRDEIHLLDHAVRDHQIVCMSCVKLEGSIVEPIEASEEAALLCIRRRLAELGYLPR